MHSRSSHRLREGFTLLELLVVMTVIAVLTAMVFAGVRAGRSAADKTRCLDTMRGIGVSMHLYAADNAGRLPDTSHSRSEDGVSRSWSLTLAPYLEREIVPRCPVSEATSPVTYAWNDLLADSAGGGFLRSAAVTPSETIAMAETAPSYTSEHLHFAGARGKITLNQFKAMVNVEAHHNCANYLFLDGHVECLSVALVRERLKVTNNTFLYP